MVSKSIILLVASCVLLASSSFINSQAKWTSENTDDLTRIGHKGSLFYIEKSLQGLLSEVPFEPYTNFQGLFTPETPADESLCIALEKALNRAGHKAIYVFEGYLSVPYSISKCGQNKPLILIQVNSELFSSLNLQEKGFMFTQAIQNFPDQQLLFDYGSLCLNGLHFDKISKVCERQKRILVHMQHYETERDQTSVHEAVQKFGLEILNREILLTMFDDLNADIKSKSPLTSGDYDVYLEDLSLIMDSVHFEYLSSEDMDSIYGFLWADGTLLAAQPSDTGLEYLLDQSSLYILYRKYSTKSYEKVTEYLDGFFRDYSFEKLSTTISITIQSSSGYDPKIYLYKGKVLEENLLGFSQTFGNKIFTIEKAEEFYGTFVYSFLLIDFQSSVRTYSNFYVQMYDSGTYDPNNNNLEIPVLDTPYHLLGNRILMSVEVPNSYSSQSAIHCYKASCYVPSFDSTSTTVPINFVTGDLYEIREFSCSETSDTFAAYIDYRDKYSISSAIALYNSVDEISTCLLTQIWLDLKDYTQSTYIDGDVFGVFDFTNDNIVMLMSPNHNDVLTDELMNDMIGYMYLGHRYIPEMLYEYMLYRILDQAALYIDYYSFDEKAFKKADSILTIASALFSDLTLFADVNIVNLSSEPITTDTTIWFYKAKIYKDELASYSFSVDNANVQLLIDTMAEGSDIVSVFFLLYQSTSYKVDQFSFHIFDAEYLDLGMEKETELSINADAVLVTLFDKGSGTLQCLNDHCSIASDISSGIQVTISKEGFYSFSISCDSTTEWYQYDQDCGPPCDPRCAKCDINNSGVCLNCEEEYDISDTSTCVICDLTNCETCSSDHKCKTCSSSYSLSSYSMCVECLSNCDICSTENICLTCSTGYRFSTSLECIQCKIDYCYICSANSKCYKCISDSYSLNTNYACEMCTAPCKECSTSLTTCTKCGKLAKLSSNKCSCITNASFDTNGIDCKCNTDYSEGLVDGSSQCVMCKRYLDSTDLVKAYFSDDYEYIYIDLKYDIVSLSKCSDYIQDSEKLGTGSVCKLTNNGKTIEVKLGSGISTIIESISLRGYNIVKSDTTIACSLSINTLTLAVTHNSAISTPTVTISGKRYLYGACTKLADQIYTGTISKDYLGLGYTYKWSYIASASGIAKQEDLDFFFDEQLKSSITLVVETFFSEYTGTITLNLTVTNGFGESGFGLLTIAFSSKKGLSVDIQGGNKYNIYVDTTWQFKSVITDYCGKEGTATYGWQLYYTNETDSFLALTSLGTSFKLVIDKNLLSPGYFYNFTVTAFLTGLQGTEFLEIYTLYKPLVVLLDGPSYTLQSKDLILSAKRSYDPNNKAALITCVWSCLSSSDICTASLNQYLSSTTSTEITIKSTLLPQFDTAMNIKVVGKSGNLEGSATITITIRSSLQIITEILLPDKKVALGKDLKIITNIQVVESVTNTGLFEWTSDENLVLENPYNPYLYIKAGTMTKGGYEYTFRLNVNGANSYTVISKITTNKPPVCNSNSLNTKNGYAVFDIFEFTSDCTDGDDEDYPLTPKISYENKGIKIFIGSGGSDKEKKSRFPKGEWDVNFSICDSLGDCYTTVYKINVELKSSRVLTVEDDCKELYLEIIRDDPDDLPMIITVIASSYSFSLDFLEYLLEDLDQYALDSGVKDQTMLDVVLTSMLSLIDEIQIPSITKQYMTNVYNSTYGILEDYSNYFVFQEDSMVYINLIAETLSTFNTTDLELLEMSKNLLNFASKIYFNDKLPDFEYTSSSEKFNSTIKRYSAKYLESNKIPANDSCVLIQLVGLNLNFSDDGSDLMFDIIIVKYNNISEDSGGIEVTVTPAGEIVDYNFEELSEEAIPITYFDEPILIDIPTTNKTAIDSTWLCGYIDNGQIITTNCTIVSIYADYVTISVKHLSLYIIESPGDVPYTCQTNYGPIILVIATFFIELFILPYAMMLDESNSKIEHQNGSSDQILSKTIEASYPSSPLSITDRHLYSSSIGSYHEADDSSVSVSLNRELADYTIEFVLNPLYDEKKVQQEKSFMHKLLEGHMLFGFFYSRDVYTRALRITTIFTTVLLQLLIEGLMFYAFENYERGSAMSTPEIFSNFDLNYLGYCGVAIGVAFPVEMFFMIVFSRDKKKNMRLYTSALALALFITIGVFVGVFILTFMFCYKWSGYWVYCYLWSGLIEVFLLQVIYMFVRYFAFRDKANIKLSKA